MRKDRERQTARHPRAVNIQQRLSCIGETRILRVQVRRRPARDKQAFSRIAPPVGSDNESPSSGSGVSLVFARDLSGLITMNQTPHSSLPLPLLIPTHPPISHSHSRIQPAMLSDRLPFQSHQSQS